MAVIAEIRGDGMAVIAAIPAGMAVIAEMTVTRLKE